MKRAYVSLMAAVLAGVLVVGGCAPAAPAAPTQAPAPPKAAAPAPTAVPAKPTAAPAAPTVAPTAVPAKKVEWPEKGRPITIIAVAGAGGTVDLTSRMLAPILEKDLGAPVSVKNVAGGATLIGSYEMMKAKPDGYTLALLSLSSLTMGYLDSEKKLPINGRQDFQPIGITSVEPSVNAVLASKPYKDLADLVNAAKANPEKVTLGTTGLFGPNHLAASGMQEEAGVKFAYVHFDGAGPAITALQGGHTDSSLVTVGGSTSALVKAGTARLLAVSGLKRNPYYPDLKSWSEYGYKTELNAPYLLGAPAGTPKEVVDVLTNSLKKAMDSPEAKKLAESQTMTLQYMDPKTADTYWGNFESTIKRLLEIAKKQAK